MNRREAFKNLGIMFGANLLAPLEEQYPQTLIK